MIHSSKEKTTLYSFKKVLPSTDRVRNPVINYLGTISYSSFKSVCLETEILLTYVRVSYLAASPMSGPLLQVCQSTCNAPAIRLTHQQRPSKMRMYLPKRKKKRDALVTYITVQTE